MEDSEWNSFSPQIIKGPEMLLDPLPEPNLAINDTLFKKFCSVIFSLYLFSILTTQNANEENAEADEAIPLLWGKVFFEFIFKNKFSKYGQKEEILLKNFSILFSKDFFVFPSYRKLNLSCPLDLGQYSIEVIVFCY